MIVAEPISSDAITKRFLRSFGALSGGYPAWVCAAFELNGLQKWTDHRPQPSLKARAREAMKKALAFPEIMTAADVAAYLLCHPATIYRLVAARQIPAFRLGADWRFRRAELLQWIEQKEAQSTAGPAPLVRQVRAQKSGARKKTAGRPE